MRLTWQIGVTDIDAAMERCRSAGIGFEDSDEAAPATVERYLAELDTVVDTVSPRDPVILAGHSLGGLIARLYQNERPSRVSGLVLLDSTSEAVSDDRAVQADSALTR